MKRRWFIGGVVAALALLGLAGGAIMAQESEGKESRFSAFAERVASILGLEADDVEDAMEQAKEELADEALDAKLDSLVADGTITQAQADEYEAWIDSQPDGLLFRGWHWGGKRGSLDTMVEKGIITQEQADEYQAWIDSKPDSLESLEKPGRHKFGDRDGWKGWYGDKSDTDDES